MSREALRRLVCVSAFVLAAAAGVGVVWVGGVSAGASAAALSAGSGNITVSWAATRFVCDLVGFPSSPEAREYGLVGNGLGYSFLARGQLWWLFGDSHATEYFPTTSTTPNAATRWPHLRTGAASFANDSIATSSTKPDACPNLKFFTEAQGVRGAWASPTVAPDPLHDRGQVSLRTNETPLAGIALGSGADAPIFTAFSTDNPCDVHKLVHVGKGAVCDSGGGDHGRSTRSVMAEYEKATATTIDFKGLFDIAAPITRYGDGAKFVQDALQQASDGYVYIWGSAGGSQTDQSPVYLARLPANPKQFNAAHLYYYHHEVHGNIDPWVADRSAGSQSLATPLFASTCISFVGVQYNRYLHRWLMLYACRHRIATPGIYLRTAPNPWGPWSPGQLIFNPAPNPTAKTGFCYFLHSVATHGVDDCANYSPTPPNPISTPADSSAKPDESAGVYFAPEPIPGWTTGSRTTSHGITTITTTIYYSLSTLNPYGEVILDSPITETVAHAVRSQG